jgi:hypothetical protein
VTFHEESESHKKKSSVLMGKEVELNRREEAPRLTN